jgi:hypothetical protein
VDRKFGSYHALAAKFGALRLSAQIGIVPNGSSAEAKPTFSSLMLKRARLLSRGTNCRLSGFHLHYSIPKKQKAREEITGFFANIAVAINYETKSTSPFLISREVLG